LPPGHSWVPGHWQQVENGWQWSSGFWAAAEQQEVEYLPPPPESIDAGPQTPAPEATMTYNPGCWVYRETRYYWRPGFWVHYRPGWCWIPAHYCWTPAGYVFIEGYWDHPLHERGLLFAPCRFDGALLARSDFRFVPSFVVQPDFLISALFIRGATRTYWFG